MPSLTVAEKNHWRDRIAARIDRAVERIKAAHPATFEKARRDAHDDALASLGLAGPHAELESIRVAEADLSRRKSLAQRTMLSILRGVPIHEVSDAFSVRYGPELPLPTEAALAISKRQSAHQERLLADDPVGRQVAGLEVEKDNLLDTVWLACSPEQVRALWARVAELLGDEPTRLEREALAIAPGKED